MGQTYTGCVDAKFQDAGCAECRSEDAHTAAVARHMLESEAPFTKVDSANCMLFRASRDGDLDAIHRAIADGADPNTRLFSIGEYTAKRSDDADSALGLTPLMYAAQEGRAEAVELLLHLGAKVDLYEADRMQALHFAALSASLGCFRILLGAGANPVARDNFGRDALECVPLAEVAAGPSKGDWLKLFSEVSCWLTPVDDTSSLQLAQQAPSSASGCEARPARPDEEVNKSDTIASSILVANNGVEEAKQTALTSDAENDSDEANVSPEILVTINEHPNEMEGLHQADRKLSYGSETSIESESHQYPLSQR